MPGRTALPAFGFSTMNVLVLDLSTSTGFSVQKHDGSNVTLIAHGTLVNDKIIEGFGEYPFNYLRAARNVADLIRDELLSKYKPDVIVIEETNGGGRHSNRYTQKILEFIHYAVLDMLQFQVERVVYINTSDWRKSVKSHLSKEDKKINSKIANAKRQCKDEDGKVNVKKFNALKKQLGVKGKVSKKHVTIRLVNAMFDLELKAKDDDVADAIAMGVAYANGVPHCDGKVTRKGKDKDNGKEEGVE